MSTWRKGQLVYEKLIENIAQYVSEQSTEVKAIDYAKTIIPDFIGGLTVNDLVLIHEYLMYITETRPDVRVPVYVYSGGDRVISVTRYLMKNVDHELAKQYV